MYEDALTDRQWMQRALRLASAGWARVHPNPMVGAVIVKNGALIGEGYHAEYGGPHAEVAALQAAGPAAAGATMYVTLEPCRHWGKTPPCTNAVIRAGISRVVLAASDPSPDAGGGAELLRAAGIEVVTGVCAEEAERQNAVFFHAQRTRLPFVTLKLAMSLDGCIAAAPGVRTTITGPEANRCVHTLRAGYDAILVGANTARVDDPLLTVRGPVEPIRPPIRVVLDTNLSVSTASALVASTMEAPVWLLTREDAPVEQRWELERFGVRSIGVPAGPDGLDLRVALGALHSRGVRSIFCEGGARVAASLLAADVVERLHVFFAPVLLGNSGVRGFAHEAMPIGFEVSSAETLGRDVHIQLERRRVSAPREPEETSALDVHRAG